MQFANDAGQVPPPPVIPNQREQMQQHPPAGGTHQFQLLGCAHGLWLGSCFCFYFYFSHHWHKLRATIRKNRKVSANKPVTKIDGTTGYRSKDCTCKNLRGLSRRHGGTLSRRPITRHEPPVGHDLRYRLAYHRHRTEHRQREHQSGRPGDHRAEEQQQNTQ